MKSDPEGPASIVSSSMDKSDSGAGLSASRVDHLVSGLRAALGFVPWIGPVVAEIVGYVIPNQRVDRIARFALILANRLESIEQQRLEQACMDPAFVDLFEDGLHQATRALTQNRLEHIADLIKNSLNSEQTQYIGDKHLLNLLGEINDVELLLMKYHSILDPEEAEQFWLDHQAALETPHATFGSSQEDIDKHTLYGSYKQHLARLGLLTPRFKRPKKGELPEFDNRTGTMKANGYEVASLGRLLLRRIDMIRDEDETQGEE